MAGIVTHIFCALSLISSGALKITNERAFITGVVYPDIRVMNILAYESIGKPDATWNDVLNAPTDFDKGLMLHGLIDQTRIQHLEKPLEQKLPTLPFIKGQLLRFYEDSVLYSRIINWPKIMGYFDFVLPEERTQNNLPDDVIKSWHTLLRTYCKQQPSAMSSHLIFNELPQVRSIIPHGLPSLASKAYVAIALRNLKKGPATPVITKFYDSIIPLVTGK